MGVLQDWGWTTGWAERFAPHAREDCFPARITVEHKGLYHFASEQGEGRGQVSGRLRHAAAGRADFPAVGDWVAVTAAADTGPARIDAVLPRCNRLSRKAAGTTTAEQILAANLDVLFLVTSLNQDLNARRIERFLAGTVLPGCRPVILLSKRDLCGDPAALVDGFRALLPDVPIHAVSARTGQGLEALAPYLCAGQTAAMLGSSGVGKSTLLNALLCQERQEVQPVREDDDRGRHTTTGRELIALPQGGLLIDSPGLREFQLWDEGVDVDAAFVDVARLAERCGFGDCSHAHEPRCAVRQAVAEGLLDPARLESYFKLTRELAYLETRLDPRAERERKERDRRAHRTYNKQKRRRE